MYGTVKFLATILPPLNDDEWYVYATPCSGGFAHTACKTVQALCDKALDMSAQGFDSYFALASTQQNIVANEGTLCVAGRNVVRRRKLDVHAFKSLWVDLDCGDGKAYASQAEARQVLTAFVAATGLQYSYLVSSGNGLHVYWAFARPYFMNDDIALNFLKKRNAAITMDQWIAVRQKYGLSLREELSSLFFAVCKHFGVKLDTAATDASRVLRVPGTYNYKSTPKPCEVLEDVSVVWEQGAFERICRELVTNNNITINKKKSDAPAAEELRKCEGTVKLVGLDRVVAQCKQMSSMGLSVEPAWRAAICVCLLFEDGPEWVHRLSALDTSRYDSATTDTYINRCPPSAVHCTTFADYQPGICEYCQHFGKITSPVQLTRQTGEAVEQVPPVQRLTYPDYMPTAVPYKSFGDTDFFCDRYGVWKKQVDDNKNPIEPLHVTNAIIEYLYSTIGATADAKAEALDVFRIYVIGSLEAFIRYYPTKYFSDSKKTMEWCGANRLLAVTSQKLLVEFMNAYLKQQVIHGSVNLRPQYDAYGWYAGQAGEIRFILDNYAITETNAVPIGPVQTHKEQIELPFTRAGSLEEWKKIPRIYKELRQPLGELAICMAFAAPFLHYGVGEAKNCIMNIYSFDGGRGKSHLLKACASVYGNPARAFLQNSASSSATQKVLAMNRHLPVFMDEIGNRQDDDLAALVFTMINGVEKQKLNRDSSIKNTGWWSTAIFTTANKPLKDVMFRVFANTDAGVLRVMDCECKFAAPAPGSAEFTLINDTFSLLENNYGLAGPDLVWHVLQDPARLSLLSSIANAFVVNNNFQTNERFYSYSLAIALTVGRWAVEFGLLDYDMDALERYVLHELVPALRNDNADYHVDYENDFNEFINDNIRRNCLIVLKDARDNERQIVTASGIVDSYVLQYPIATINMRYEVANKRLFISQKSLADWCKRENRTSRSMVSFLRKNNILEKKSVLINLSKHVPRYAAARIRCYVVTEKYLADSDLHINKNGAAYVPTEQLTVEEKEQLINIQKNVSLNAYLPNDLNI